MTSTVTSRQPIEAFELLHLLRIRGRVAADQLDTDDAVIEALSETDLIRMTERGAVLTSKGFHQHLLHLEDERAKIDLDLFAGTYDRFLRVNQPIKDVCASWQARGTSASEDDSFKALDALEDFFERIRPSLSAAADIVPRFQRYLDHLAAALDRVAEGERKFLADPHSPSFHTVWFECHEDYLLTRGRDRDSEEKELG